MVVRSQWSTRRHLLSAGLRQQWEDLRQELVVKSDNLDAIAASVIRPTTVMGSVERLLLLLAKRTPRLGRQFLFDAKTDYPLLVALDAEEAHTLYYQCQTLFWLDAGRRELTIDGWRKVDELRAVAPKSHQAFVAMWFDARMDDAWLNGFIPGIRDSNYYTATRVDGFEHNGKIDDLIVLEIKRSGLLVADLTGQRGGVYFEAGLAMGRDIPVIWTCRADYLKEVHFDTRQYNFIVWDDVAYLRERLTARILATVVPRVG